MVEIVAADDPVAVKLNSESVPAKPNEHIAPHWSDMLRILPLENQPKSVDPVVHPQLTELRQVPHEDAGVDAQAPAQEGSESEYSDDCDDQVCYSCGCGCGQIPDEDVLMIPCTGCNIAKYCCEECVADHWTNGHQYQCAGWAAEFGTDHSQ